MPNEMISYFKDLEQYIAKTLETDGFTSECERMMYSIAEYCVNNGISVEKYNTLIFG